MDAQRNHHDDQTNAPQSGTVGKFSARVKNVLQWPLRVVRLPLRVLSPVTRVVARPTRSLRAWVAPRGKLLGIATVVLLLLTMPLVMRQWVIQAIAPPPRPPTAEDALRALDDADLVQAKQIAEALEQLEEPSEDTAGVPGYVLGYIALQDADQHTGPRQIAYCTLAARRLAESQAKGFPVGRERLGAWLLAKSLFQSRQFVAARAALEEVIQHDSGRAARAEQLLAQAYHHGPDQDLKQALAHNTRFLDTKPKNSGDAMDAWWWQARILFELGDTAACQGALAKITPDARNRAAISAMRGRLLLQEAQAIKRQSPSGGGARELLQQAIMTLREAIGFATGDSPAAAESAYFLGVCQLELNDQRAAIDQFSRTFKQYPEREEGVAAGLHFADLLQRADRDDEAVDLYRRVVQSAGKPEEYFNTWLTLADFRRRLLAAQQAWLQKGDFDRAIRLAEASPPILAKEEALQRAAQALRGWAQSLLARAEQATVAEARDLQRQARDKLRQAGERFGQLAQLRITSRQYPDDLWDGAQSFLAGRDYSRAVQTYLTYLRVEPRKRRSLALLALGEAHLSQGQTQPALAAFRECLDAFPSDPACFRVRYMASRALRDERDRLGDTGGEAAQRLANEAEALLRQNLDGESLTPASVEFRESLFALGKLLYERGLEADLQAQRKREQALLAHTNGDDSGAKAHTAQAEAHQADAQQRFEEAVTRLDEAARRYPEASGSIEARYLVAEAFRHAAHEPKERLRTDTIENARVAHLRQMQQMLGSAVAQYEQLRDLLNRRQERTELVPLEQAMLRNSYFLQGAALFEAGRYDESIRAYSTATNRYQESPEVLEAYLQIANCYWRLNRLEEFRGTIAQAKVVLKGMKDEPATSTLFRRVTSLDRSGWQAQLDWLATLGNPAAEGSTRTAANTP